MPCWFVCAQDAAIAKSEVELKRRTDEIERKTRETDNLNRKLERLLAAQPGGLAPLTAAGGRVCSWCLSHQHENALWLAYRCHINVTSLKL